MTRVQRCGVRLRATGLGISIRGSTTILTRAPQPQELPSPSLSQVLRSRPLFFNGTNVLMGTGTRVWLYGGIMNATNAHGEYISYPTAEYTLDGVSGESTDRNAASLGAYLIPHYSRIPTANHRPNHEEVPLLPDNNTGRWHPQS